jgi:hypothetical protein
MSAASSERSSWKRFGSLAPGKIRGTVPGGAQNPQLAVARRGDEREFVRRRVNLGRLGQETCALIIW